MTQQERIEYVNNLQMQSAKDKAKRASITAMYQEREKLTNYAFKVLADQMTCLMLTGLNPNMYLPKDEK